MTLRQTILLMLIVLASCFLCFSSFAQPTSAGLLAHFKFSGNTLNSGPAAVTATATGTSYVANNAGSPASAIQFNGNLSSFVDVVDNGNLDFAAGNNFTISFSFYFNGSSTGGLIDNCLNYGGWGVWLWSTVSGVWNLQFNYRNNSVGSAAATSFSLGTWHHVAAVRNNGTISLYIDGIFRLSATEGTQTPSYPINMVLGAMGYGGFTPPRYNPLNGRMDELRIYNRALSLAEIRGLSPYALPLTLADLHVINQGSVIKMNWQTLNELNTSHFEIERSSDGIHFTTIGSVSAAGNSSDTRNYGFTDMQPSSGTNFYRLKMIDIDQTFTYSRVVAVKNESSQLNLQLFPNPAADIVQVQIPSSRKQQATVLITDAGGKVMLQKDILLEQGYNGNSIPVSQLPAGTYFLIIQTESGRQTAKFSKR